MVSWVQSHAQIIVDWEWDYWIQGVPSLQESIPLQLFSYYQNSTLLTYWLCKFGQTLHIDRTLCVLHVAIQVEGQSHDTHTKREKWEHGQDADTVPQPAFPARVVNCWFPGDRVSADASMVLWSDLLWCRIIVCVPEKAVYCTLSLPELMKPKNEYY